MINDEEILKIILGIYLFERNRVSQKFLNNITNKINAVFDVELNSQLVAHTISAFRNLDSSHRQNTELKDDLISKVWKDYYLSEKIDFLKSFYIDFKNTKVEDSLMLLNISQDHEEISYVNLHFSDFDYNFKGDKPKIAYKTHKTSDGSKYVRNPQIVYNAIKLANYDCEVSSQHKSFIRKNNKKKYTEGHHLIPLKYSNKFKYNLDVEANVVSLCSDCHNFLHYGNFPDEILKMLFYKRKKRLEDCGIYIKLDDLIEMYR